MHWARITKAVVVIALAMPLLGMDGCAQSRNPLSTVEAGYVDPYLLGDWYSSYVGETGQFQPEQLHLQITAEGNEMLVRWYDGDQYCDLTGYSSRFKDKKYVNLKLQDCSYWTATDKTSSDFAACPYHLIQYKTFMPKGLAGYIDTASRDIELSASAVRAAAEIQRGQTLYYAFLWGDLVKDAIEAEELAGIADCADCGSQGPCVQADAADLQAFLFEYDAELYPGTLRNWVVVVRRPSQLPGD